MCTKFDFRWGSVPEMDFRGLLLMGGRRREGTEAKGKEEGRGISHCMTPEMWRH